MARLDLSAARPAALVAGAIAVLLAVAGLVGRSASAHPDPGPAPRTTPVDLAPRPELPGARAVRVLEEWQEARSRAYSVGGVGALRRLHAPGSEAGRRDVAVLRAWASRGLGLDLVTETGAVSVLVARPRLVVLRQRARVRAVAEVAGERRRLPAGGWSWRRVTLRQLDGRWVLSSATREPGGTPREPP
jgi:hypothetical protein